MVYRTPLAFVALAALAVPAFAFAQIDTSLDIGDRGSNVTELQQYLATDNTLYPEGLVTGYFGPLTQAAVERFQCRADIVCSGNPRTTGYGRVGPRTRAAVNAQLGTGGAVGDRSAPIMSPATVATTSTEFTVSWSTNEPARSRVMYSTAWPFRYQTAADVMDSTVNTNSAVTVSGLAPATTYFVVRESVDRSGNIMWTASQTIRTGSE